MAGSLGTDTGKAPPWQINQIRLRNTSQEFVPRDQHQPLYEHPHGMQSPQKPQQQQQQHHTQHQQHQHPSMQQQMRHSASANLQYTNSAGNDQHQQRSAINSHLLSNTASHSAENLHSRLPQSPDRHHITHAYDNDQHAYGAPQQHHQYVHHTHTGALHNPYSDHNRTRAGSNDHSMNDRQSQINSNSGHQQHDSYSTQLYKTELCKSYADTGFCRYGLKCRFAHGQGDLRPIIRHKKYKTERCKNFAETGVCPYGPRCRFIHNVETGDVDDVQTTYSGGSQSGSSQYTPQHTPYNGSTRYATSPIGSLHSTPSHSRHNTQQHQQYTDMFHSNNSYASPVGTVRSQPVSATISPAIMPSTYSNNPHMSSSASGPRSFNQSTNSVIPPLSLYQRNHTQQPIHTRNTVHSSNNSSYTQPQQRQQSLPHHYVYASPQHTSTAHQRESTPQQTHTLYNDIFSHDINNTPEDADEHIKIHSSASSAALLRDFDANDTDDNTDVTDEITARQSVMTLLDDNAPPTASGNASQTVSILSMIQSPRSKMSDNRAAAADDTGGNTEHNVDSKYASQSPVDTAKPSHKAMSPFFSPVPTAFSPTFSSLSNDSSTRMTALPPNADKSDDTTDTSRSLVQHNAGSSGHAIRQSSTLGILRTTVNNQSFDSQPSTATTETSDYLRPMQTSPYLSNSPALSSGSYTSQMSPNQSPLIQSTKQQTPHHANAGTNSGSSKRLPVFSNLSVAISGAQEQQEYIAQSLHKSPLMTMPMPRGVSEQQVKSPLTASDERKQ